MHEQYHVLYHVLYHVALAEDFCEFSLHLSLAGLYKLFILSFTIFRLFLRSLLFFNYLRF